MVKLNTGDILCEDGFYKIIKITTKTMTLQKLQSKTDRETYIDTNFYIWTLPTDELFGEPFRCSIKESENRKGIPQWWIAKYSIWVEKFDGKPICYKIWNYGDASTYLSFDQELYDSAKHK